MEYDSIYMNFQNKQNNEYCESVYTDSKSMAKTREWLAINARREETDVISEGYSRSL